MIHRGHGSTVPSVATLLGLSVVAALTPVPSKPGGVISADGCPISQPSQHLLQAVPDVVARISSQNGEDRTRLLWDLLVVHDGGCSRSVSLRPDVSKADYEFVVCEVQRDLGRAKLTTETKRTLFAAFLEIARQATLDGRLVAPTAITALQDIDPVIRSMAIRLLTLARTQEYAREIAKCLDDPDLSVQRNALEALKELGSPLAIPKLVEQLREPEALRRYYAVQDLVKLDARKTSREIERLLADPHENNRPAALRALYQFETVDICPRLQGLIEHGEQSEMFNVFALAMCAKWGNEWPIPLIIERLKHRDLLMDGVLRELQVTALAAPIVLLLRDPTMLGGDVGSNANIRSDAMRLLAKLDPSAAIPILREHAKDAASHLSLPAAELLGDLRAKEAVPELLPLLDHHPRWHVALPALAKIADADTVPEILSRIRERKRDETTWRVLGYLCRAADEPLYEKLTTPCEFILPDGPLPTWFDGLRRQCGVRLSVTDAIPAEFLSRPLQERKYATPMQVVDYIFYGVLNYGEARFAMYFQDGVAHIGTIDEAFASWDDWLASRR